MNFEVTLEGEDGWTPIRQTLPESNEDGDENDDNMATKILWRCPNSRNLPLPPHDGWSPPVDESARGQPADKDLTLSRSSRTSSQEKSTPAGSTTISKL